MKTYICSKIDFLQEDAFYNSYVYEKEWGGEIYFWETKNFISVKELC